MSLWREGVSESWGSVPQGVAVFGHGDERQEVGI